MDSQNHILNPIPHFQVGEKYINIRDLKEKHERNKETKK